MSSLTTFIIPSIDRPSLPRAIASAYGQAPTLFEVDTDRIGEAIIRNRLIQKADTPWVSFLDDDDTVTSDYVQRLQEEIEAHPEADIIHFREYFLRTGQVFPNWPEVVWGNVGIAFSIKRDIALEHPFQTEPYEDYHFIRRLYEKGYKIHFSRYLTYKERH